MTMTTPTPIETFEDILAALERNPQLQAALRQHILDQEFLQLPAIVRELQQAVAQLTQLVHEYITATDARLGRIEADVAEIKDQQATMSSQIATMSGEINTMSGDINTMSGDINTMSGHIANLSGRDYESRAVEQSRRMIRGNLDMMSATVIHASRWEAQTFERNVLLPAIAGRRISRQEANQLESADCVIQCEDQEGRVVHAVAEISITVQDRDRSRADERAKILAKATGTQAVAYVVGQEQEAQGQGVPDVVFLEYSG